MIISLCLMMFLVTGCGKVAELENGEDIVASFNGTTITANDLYDEIKNRYARDLLIAMIDRAILDKEYENTDELLEYVDGSIDYYKQQLGIILIIYQKSNRC